jgi:hypothetical protein
MNAVASRVSEAKHLGFNFKDRQKNNQRFFAPLRMTLVLNFLTLQPFNPSTNQ